MFRQINTGRLKTQRVDKVQTYCHISNGGILLVMSRKIPIIGAEKCPSVIVRKERQNNKKPQKCWFYCIENTETTLNQVLVPVSTNQRFLKQTIEGVCGKRVKTRIFIIFIKRIYHTYTHKVSFGRCYLPTLLLKDENLLNITCLQKENVQ